MTDARSIVTPPGPGTDGSTPAGDKAWPAIVALFTAGLLPATTARRTDPVSLGGAYGLHWLAVLLGAIVLLLLAGWGSAIQRWPDGGRILAGTSMIAGEIIEEFERDPKLATVAAAGIVLGVELTFLVLALAVAPWGARDEPMRASVAGALRRTWLHTPHLLPALLVAGVWVNGLWQARADWMRRNPSPTWPASSAVSGPSKNQLADWQSKMTEWYRRSPWYVRDWESLVTYGCFGAIAWFLWGLFRSVGADRRTPRVARPPTCEGCGYNLTSAAMDGRCPECGEPVAWSLGPDVRPGVPWQRRRESGLWRAWWRCAVDSAVRPKWFGRQIQLSTADVGHRRFLALHLPVFFLIGAVGIVGCYVVATGRNPVTRDPAIVWGLGPLVGCFTAAFMIAFALGAAWLVALHYRAGADRNLLSGTMQVASYLSGYLVLWVLFAAMMGMLVFALRPWFRTLGGRAGIDPELLMFLAWSLSNVSCMVVYLVLVARGAAGLRFANR